MTNLREITLCTTHVKALRHELELRGLGAHMDKDMKAVGRAAIIGLLTDQRPVEAFDAFLIAYTGCIMEMSHAAMALGVFEWDGVDDCPPCLACIIDAHHAKCCPDPKCDLHTKGGPQRTFESSADRVLTVAMRHGFVSVPGAES